MIIPPIPDNETERLNALNDYAVMDSEEESDYDSIVKLASSICETPISLITLINEDRQWFKSKIGISKSETSREFAFCAYTILNNHLMEVNDAKADERFIGNPLVDGDDNIRFYAGMPLATPSGHNLGSLCVIDHIPRQLTEFQKEALRILSQQVIHLFELRRKNRELTHLQSIQNRLMSIIGHDLRTPIASVTTLLELCDEYNMTMDEFKKMLPDIRKNADAAGELVINLLDWAQAQINGLHLNKVVLPIRSVAQHIISDNFWIFDSKSNTVVNELPEKMTVWGDRNMVEFILRNLLLNANKFTESGVITLNELNGAIQVRDTGAGIQPDRIENLFSWEKRTSTPGTRSERGSGLGLPMSWEFVTLHGGKIRVESTPEAGTLVHFTLG